MGAFVNLNGDNVSKMGDVERRNLGPIPEELNLEESEDLDSDLSMAVQKEIDTLSQR